MHRIQSLNSLAHKFSVIVHDFDLLRVAVAPHKANPPLAIDADTVLAFPGSRSTLPGDCPAASRKSFNTLARCKYSSLRRAVF